VPHFFHQIDAETLRGRTWTSWSNLATSPAKTLQAFVEMLFPWSLLLPAAVAHAWRRRSGLRDDPLLLPLVWLGAVLAMNMSVGAPRWRYLLPALPPAALLVARTWVSRDEGRLQRGLTLGPLAGLLTAFALMGLLSLADVVPARRVLYGLPEALETFPWRLVP